MSSELPKAVSVVMRCMNEGWAVGGTLKMLANQDFEGEIELIAMDIADRLDDLHASAYQSLLRKRWV